VRVARLVREIATAGLGRDPGPLTAVASDSHQVYVGSLLTTAGSLGGPRCKPRLTASPRGTGTGPWPAT